MTEWVYSCTYGKYEPKAMYPDTKWNGTMASIITALATYGYVYRVVMEQKMQK